MRLVPVRDAAETEFAIFERNTGTRLNLLPPTLATREAAG